MSAPLAALLKYRHLQMIKALSRHLVMTRAANELGLTQPALSKGLRELEVLVGASLFERSPRGLKPTATGLELAAFARSALAELAELEARLAPSADQAADLAIGILPVAAVGIAPSLMRRLRETYPNLRVRFIEGRTEALLSQLEAGEVEVVIGRLYPPSAPDAFEREQLYVEPISVMARTGHPLSKLKSATAEDLGRYELVLPAFSQRIAYDIEHYMDEIGLAASAATVRSTSRGFIQETVLGGDAITILPRLFLGGDILRGLIRVLPVTAPRQLRPAGVTTFRRRVPGLWARRMITCLRLEIAELAELGGLDIA